MRFPVRLSHEGGGIGRRGWSHLRTEGPLRPDVLEAHPIFSSFLGPDAIGIEKKLAFAGQFGENTVQVAGMGRDAPFVKWKVV